MVQFVDEETGLTGQNSNQTTNRQTSNSSNQFSIQSSSSNISDSEYNDHVSEMSPLIGDSELVPPVAYDGLDNDNTIQEHQQHQYPHRLQRVDSEESIQTVAALPGMVIRCHSINMSGGGSCILRPSTTKVALKAVQIERRAARKRQQQSSNNALSVEHNISNFGKESYWIDIETPTRSTDELADFLKQLRLPPFFVSVLSEPFNWTSEFIALKQVSLAIFQILPPDPKDEEINHVALLSMPRLLVTFSTFTQTNTNNVSTGRLYQLVTQYMKQKERVPQPSSSGLLLAWLQFHVRRTSRAIRELRLATVIMDEEMDEDRINFDFEQLVEAKNCLLRVLSVAEEQQETIEALVVAEESTEGVDFANCKGALSMLCANSSSNERLSSRVDKHMNELRERCMSHREDTLNQRLALLTILSAIFMPLTLLTGIWGMNFESMPELQYEGAYQKALFGMITLALCLVYSFKRAGWSSH